MDSATAATPPWRRDATLVMLVGSAHGISHFSQLLLAPLFPWLKDAFGVGFAELGFLLTIFFVVSCVVQTLSGFWVDRFGPRPVLFAGLALLGLAALGYAASTSYAMLAVFSVVAGVGNGVFHPVDYSLINRKVAKAHLGHAYSVHGITGSLGWALAPLVLVPITVAFSWRVALASAALLIFVVLAVIVVCRRHLALEPLPPAPKADGLAVEGSLDFLRIPAVWMCFGFFFFFAGALSVIQAFAPAAAGRLHAVPAELAAMCLTVYMVCSAGGMVVGGFLASNHERSERIVGIGFGIAAIIALALGYLAMPSFAVPVLFGVMGFVTGTAGPSRDIIVKRAAPDNATGRVYGVVYSGLDIGQAVIPLLIGHLMDLQQYAAVFLALAVLQGVLVFYAFGVRRVRRTVAMPATA